MSWDLDRTGVYAIDPTNDRLVFRRELKDGRVAVIEADILEDDENHRTRETILAHIKWRDNLLQHRVLWWRGGECRGRIPQLIADHLRKHGIGSKSLTTERRVLFRRNGEVIEILPDGSLGDVLVPAREL